MRMKCRGWGDAGARQGLRMDRSRIRAKTLTFHDICYPQNPRGACPPQCSPAVRQILHLLMQLRQPQEAQGSLAQPAMSLLGVSALLSGAPGCGTGLRVGTENWLRVGKMD